MLTRARIWPALLLLIALLYPPAAAWAQVWQWAAGQTITSSTQGVATVNAVAVDGAGRTVVAGEFRGSVQFGSLRLTSTGDADIFVAWLDAAGNWLSAARAGGSTSYDYARRVAIDPAGNALVVGSFQSFSADFGSFTLTNGSPTFLSADVFAARCSPQGVWLQAQSLPGDMTDQPTSNIVFDAQGNALFGGFFTSATLQAGPFRLSRVAGLGTPFLVRLSPQGTWLQATTAGASQQEILALISQICLDAAGNVVVGGDFQGPTFTFGSTVLTNPDPTPSNAHTEMFVARLDARSNWVSAVRAGAYDSEYLYGLDFAPNGDLVVAGAFYGSTTVIGSTTLRNANPEASNLPLGYSSADIFTARLSPQGVWSQAQAVGGTGHESLAGMYLDAAGNAVIAGSYASPALSFGSTTLTNVTSSPHAFVARLGADGRWTHALAGGIGTYCQVYALAAGPDSTAVIGGMISAGAPVAFGASSVSGGYSTQGAGLVARMRLSALRTPPTDPEVAPALFPNPAHTSALFRWLTPAAQAQPVVVFDMQGREVSRQMVAPLATSATLDVRGLKAGLYVVRSGEAVGRLVID